ncbi:MAG: DUF2207 domain-containing protein [Ruminococcus sp.]|nr:DUF2207 domain-containing protein [Ruminococcus sp.]
MNSFKCKMCGAYIELTEERSVYDCKCCGAKQTVCSDIDDLLKLINRANGHRIKGEFAEAESDFRTAIIDYPEEAEGFWGMCLCKYGITYETNGESQERVACSQRTSLDSVYDDVNYKRALERCDDLGKELLRAEADTIDALQVEAFRQNGVNASCDVVISYLEKDADGLKTSDAVLAQGIYNELCDCNLKVVLMGSGQRERLGAVYNSYIDGVLNSAKAMIAVGTSNQNFYANDVRQVWDSYLDYAFNNDSKALFVCYKEMASNELPNEFNEAKSYDAKSYNGLKELIGDVEYFITSFKKREKNKAFLSTADTMIEKGFDCIEEKSWDKADSILDKAISIYPKSSRAYFGKFLVQQKIREKDAMKGRFKFALLENTYFEKAFSLATGKEKAAYEKMVRSNSSLLDRAFMWLSEGEFTEATRLATQELIGNPESSQAYLCKFLASRNYKSFEEILNANIKFIIQNDELFKKAYAYANDAERMNLDKLIEKNKSVVEKENSRYEYIEKRRKPYVEQYKAISEKLDSMHNELSNLETEAIEKQKALRRIEPVKMMLLAIALLAIDGFICFGLLKEYMQKSMKTCAIAFGISALVIIVLVVAYGCSDLRKRTVEKNAYKKYKRKNAKYKKEYEKLEDKLDEVGDVIICATCGNTKKTTHGHCKVCDSGAWYRVRYIFTDPDDCRRHMLSSMPKNYDFLLKEDEE